jgi:hypothetical protein
MTSEESGGSQSNCTPDERWESQSPDTPHLRKRRLATGGRACTRCMPRPWLWLPLLAAALATLAWAVMACGSDSSGPTRTSSEEAQAVSTSPTGSAATSGWSPEETLPAEGTLSTETTLDVGGETTTLSLAETTTSGPTKTTTTTEKLVSGEIRLEDGKIKAMGFIDEVWEAGGKRWLRIDYAELLTGEEAKEAAIKAGQLAPGEELPNDYFIRNQSHTLREYQVSKDVQITTSTWHGVMEAATTWEEFKAFWSDSPPDPEAALLRESPWWIVRDGPLVLRIDEQYLP